MPPLQRTTGTFLQTPTLRSGGLKLSYLYTARCSESHFLYGNGFLFYLKKDFISKIQFSFGKKCRSIFCDMMGEIEGKARVRRYVT